MFALMSGSGHAACVYISFSKSKISKHLFVCDLITDTQSFLCQIERKIRWRKISRRLQEDYNVTFIFFLFMFYWGSRRITRVHPRRFEWIKRTDKWNKTSFPLCFDDIYRVCVVYAVCAGPHRSNSVANETLSAKWINAKKFLMKLQHAMEFIGFLRRWRLNTASTAWMTHEFIMIEVIISKTIK